MSGIKTPKGWALARLGDVCLERVEQREPGDHPMPYIDIGSVNRDTKVIGDHDMVTRRDSPTRARQIVREGDVLVSMTRPNLNAVALVPQALHGAVASTGFDVLRAIEVLPAWIFNRVRSHDFVTDVCDGLQGVVYPAVRPHDVRRHECPIPPLPEQRRIVEAIESYFTRLDDAGATLERVQRNLKRYRASVLKAAVEGRLVPTEAELARAEHRDYESASVLLERILAKRRSRWEESGRKSKYEEPVETDASAMSKLPEGWCWASVDAVGDVLLGRRRAPQYRGQLRPYLRVANVKDDHLDLSDVSTMPFDERHLERYLLRPGDVMASEGQSPELVGQSAIYRGGIEGLCFQATLHRFRPFHFGPSSEFAQLVFRAHVRAGVFRRLASITTNIAHLTLEKFKAAPFPLPPVCEQARIVAEAERLLTIADALDVLLRQQTARCQRLRQSMLKWAFEGKLAEQDPNDEPASVLLERIKVERAGAMPTKKSCLLNGRARRTA
jgi:type I restriction enzyme, S subunit